MFLSSKEKTRKVRAEEIDIIEGIYMVTISEDDTNVRKTLILYASNINFWK